MQSLADFIAAHGITATARRADANPHMADMPRGSSHWRVTMRRTEDGRRRSLTVPFSMGPALAGPPEAAHVLSCLARDTHTIEQAGSFEAWAEDLGYNSDSRKAARAYRACEKQAARLRAWLGDDLTETLLYRTDPL